MQVKNHLFLRRDDNREAERARVTFAISLALSTIAELLSSVVYVRFTNGEAWVRFSIHFDLRFDFFDFKIGSLANKSCTLISWRSRFYLSFFSDSMSEDQIICRKFDKSCHKKILVVSVSPQRTLVEKRNRASPKKLIAPSVVAFL